MEIGLPVLSFDSAVFFENNEMMNREQILTRLSDNHLILHSMPPLGRGQGNKNDKKICEVSKNLFTYRNPLVLPQVYSSPKIESWFSFFRSIHRRRFIKKFDNRKPILYLWHPMFYKEIGRNNEALVIYHMYDDYRKFPNASSNITTWENIVLEKADFIFSSSKSLAEARSNECKRNIEFIPNAVDFTYYRTCSQNNKCPMDLADIPHPRLAYIGRINTKVDIGLITNIAERKPQWSMIFIGPVLGSDNQISKIKNLSKIPNIYFLGRKDPKELPFYYQNCDIILMSYKTDDDGWYKYCYPLKMHESFASGTPVVTSDLLEVRPFKNILTITSGVKGWINSIEEILNKNDHELSLLKEKMIDVASENSWDDRVDMIENFIKRTSIEKR